MEDKQPSPSSALAKKKTQLHQRSKLKLKRADKKALAEIMKGGRQSVRVFKRARVLQLLDLGKTLKQTTEATGLSQGAVRAVKQRYLSAGLGRVLQEAPRRIPERALNDKQEQRIVAMLCGPQPSGRARWTIRLARDEVVGRGMAAKVGRETIRVLMSNHELKPWREKNVVHPGADAGIRREDGESS